LRTTSKLNKILKMSYKNMDQFKMMSLLMKITLIMAKKLKVILGHQKIQTRAAKINSGISLKVKLKIQR